MPHMNKSRHAVAAPNLATISPRAQTEVVANINVTMPGSFARERDLHIPRDAMLLQLQHAVGGRGGVHQCDFKALAVALAGDAVYGNMLCLGVAYQKALVPVPAAAILQVFPFFRIHMCDMTHSQVICNNHPQRETQFIFAT